MDELGVGMNDDDEMMSGAKQSRINADQ